MIDIFELVVNCIETFIIILFLSIYFGFKHKDWRKYANFVIGFLLASGTITLLNNSYVYEGLFGLVLILIYFLYSLICLKGDIFTKLFIASFTDCIVLIINSETLLAFHILTGKSYELLLSFSLERIVYIIIAKLLLLVVCGILLKFKFNSMERTKNIAAVIVLSFVAELSMNEIAELMITNDNIRYELFIISIATVAIIILAYYIFIKINYDAQIQTNYIALKQKYEYDKNHAREVTELYDKICGMRHDLSIYFNNALSYIDENPQKAKTYIQSVINDRIADNRIFIETDKRCFDAIINTKLTICAKKGIFTQISVQNHSLKKLSDDEIGVIFGNLFDNAIRATEKSRDKTIELDVKIKGEYLSILMMNSVDEPVLQTNEKLVTTKNNKLIHGYGTKNIKKIVDDHNGMIDYFEENGYFGCHILII